MLKHQTFLAFKRSNDVFIMLIDVKVPPIVGILTFMSLINFVLSSVEHKNCFKTPGACSIHFLVYVNCDQQKHNHPNYIHFTSCLHAWDSGSNIIVFFIVINLLYRGEKGSVPFPKKPFTGWVVTWFLFGYTARCSNTLYVHSDRMQVDFSMFSYLYPESYTPFSSPHFPYQTLLGYPL